MLVNRHSVYSEQYFIPAQRLISGGEGLPTILSRFLEGWVPFRRAAPCGSDAGLGCRAQCSMTEAGIEQRSRTQHGAQHGQQPIRYAPQSASVRVAPGAQPHDARIVAPHSTKTSAVGAQRTGQHESVAAVILGARGKIAVAKTVQLFRIQRKYGQAALQQCFHQRPARHLDGHGQRGQYTFRQLLEPAEQLLESSRRVRHLTLSQRLALRIQDTNLMRLGTPIDAHEKCKTIFVVHTPPLAGRCSQRHPCTGAQNGANSPLGFRLQTRPKRRKSLPGARWRRGPLALSLAGRSTMVYRKGQPRRKGTGGEFCAERGVWGAKPPKWGPGGESPPSLGFDFRFALACRTPGVLLSALRVVSR